MTRRMTTIEADTEQMEFAKAAAAKFAEDSKLHSFTRASIDPGEFLALRWGLGDDCVLVLKLDDYHVPTVYGQAVPRERDSQQLRIVAYAPELLAFAEWVASRHGPGSIEGDEARAVIAKVRS